MEPIQARNRDFIAELTDCPLDPLLHFQYAVHASETGNAFLAYAELKTAELLGLPPEEFDAYAEVFAKALPDLIGMNHNQYFRFSSLSSEILKLGEENSLSVLDVGGGFGQLAAFIPAAKYCLVEPTVNGICGLDLPFVDHSFDYVVSCHVLEHIPARERNNFLDQLLSKSKRGVILLNPFHVEGTYVDERLRLVIDVTGAEWAREHLECSLPTINDIEAYATDRKLQCCIKPNGTMTTSMAFVFMDHFAAKRGLRGDLEKVNRFFNSNYSHILDSADYPNAYLVYLGRPEV